jgi:lipid-binding SYLF domain-containing protein
MYPPGREHPGIATQEVAMLNPWRSAATALLMVFPSVAAAGDTSGVNERVDRAREAYQQLVHTPDRGVPDALRERCKAIAIFPGVIKGAIGFGARYGKGIVVVRDGSGWSAPAFYTLAGGSWGFQLGAQSTDVVLYFMTDRGIRSLLESKFTLGAQAGLAAGPVGRTAEAGTDVKLAAEIYSYARSRGLFAGISLEGARMSSDEHSNAAYYGTPLSSRALLVDKREPARPSSAEKLKEALP